MSPLCEHPNPDECPNHGRAAVPTWTWTFEGYEYRAGSSQPWRGVRDSGVVAAEHPAVAAILLLTGLPYDEHPAVPDKDSLPEYDGEGGFSLTIEPVAVDDNDEGT
jgi:hypothetical protein